ncbi:MAG: GntR family transcriptional regulator [Sphingomonadales bacterium]|nr:GntR family transcriptional regulator [Sphingomonadales bacterium]MDE2171820.1 GntR family transcriptional regulator [Sphingomonadales bacterium]
MSLPPVVRGVRLVQGDAGQGARAASPTFVERAYDYLLSMILSVQIAPGERIAIDKVARKLDISQTPVREALSQLEAERLVLRTPNVGYRASPPMNRSEMHEVYTLRMLIEPYVAEQAARHMDEASLAVLRGIEEEMGTLEAGDERSYARFAEADARLHRQIADGCGNRLIAETIERLHAHLQIFRSLYRTNAPEEAAVEHRQLIAALSRRDPEAAGAAMREHLIASERRMDLATATLSDAGEDVVEA